MKKTIILLLLMAVMVNAQRVNEITTDQPGEDLILNSSAVIQVTAPVNFTNNQIEYSDPVTNTNQITNNVNGENLPYDISLQAPGSHFRIQNDSDAVDLFFVRNNGGVALPQLTNLDCLGTAGDGTIQEGVCSAGGGGESSEQDAYWTLNEDTLTINDTIAHNLNVTDNITASGGLVEIAERPTTESLEGVITLKNSGGFESYMGMGLSDIGFWFVSSGGITFTTTGLNAVIFNGDLDPGGVYNLGSDANQWNDAYIDGNVFIGGTLNASQVFSRDSGLELASGTGEIIVTGDLNATNRVCDGAGNCFEFLVTNISRISTQVTTNEVNISKLENNQTRISATATTNEINISKLEANQTRISEDVTYNLDNVSDIHQNAAWSNTAVTFTQITVDGDILSDSDSVDSVGATGGVWDTVWTDNIKTDGATGTGVVTNPDGALKIQSTVTDAGFVNIVSSTNNFSGFFMQGRAAQSRAVGFYTVIGNVNYPDGLLIVSNNGAVDDITFGLDSKWDLGSTGTRLQNIWTDNINGGAPSIWLGNLADGDIYLLHLGYDNDSGLYQEEIEYSDLVDVGVMDAQGNFKDGRDHKDIRKFIELNPTRVNKIKTKETLIESDKLQRDIEKILDKLIDKGVITNSEVDDLSLEKVKKVKVKNDKKAIVELPTTLEVIPDEI